MGKAPFLAIGQLEAQAERPDVNFVFLNQGEAAAHVRGWLQSEGLTLKNVLLDPPGRVAVRDEAHVALLPELGLTMADGGEKIDEDTKG